MPSIEGLGTPLAFKVSGSDRPAAGEKETTAVRSEFRALDGMQKEALVHCPGSGATWRMVCDEGPYLQGTDLAPFPLAFYTAGVVFSFMTEVLRHAADLGVKIDAFSLTSDHYYTMQGSALRGDMIGGAMPVEIAVRVTSDASAETVAQIVERAKASSPAEAYMRDSLRNTFALVANEEKLDVTDLEPSSRQAEDPASRFDDVEPADRSEYLDDVITKLSEAEVLEGVEGGAGSSLKAVQKRTLHVRGEARLLSGTLKEIKVQLFQPIGSNFQFLSEDGGEEKAPPALAYLSAGVGFCYMTQIGRYAHITKRKLSSYRIVQDNFFHPGEPAAAEPVDTQVFLTLDEPDDVAQKITFMSERTCFLHAALRGAYPTQVRVVEETS